MTGGLLLDAEELRWVADKQEQIGVPLSLLAIHELVEAHRETLVAKRKDMLSQDIRSMSLSIRSRNCLKKMNVTTIGDLVRVEENELRAFKNLGESNIQEIKEELAVRGLFLKLPTLLHEIKKP